MKVITNQADTYIEKVKQETQETFIEFCGSISQELEAKINDIIANKVNQINKNMESGIDIGGIIECNVVPVDIVKLEHDNGTEIYCYAIKRGKKSEYFACCQY